MQRARAFVFAAEEDFGIAPVEAQACGTPVIAYGRGGAAETVRAGETGVFFHEQTAAAIAAAVRRFEGHGTPGTPSRHPPPRRAVRHRRSSATGSPPYVRDAWATFEDDRLATLTSADAATPGVPVGG